MDQIASASLLAKKATKKIERGFVMKGKKKMDPSGFLHLLKPLDKLYILGHPDPDFLAKLLKRIPAKNIIDETFETTEKTEIGKLQEYAESWKRNQINFMVDILEPNTLLPFGLKPRNMASHRDVTKYSKISVKAAKGGGAKDPGEAHAFCVILDTVSLSDLALATAVEVAQEEDSIHCLYIREKEDEEVDFSALENMLLANNMIPFFTASFLENDTPSQHVIKHVKEIKADYVVVAVDLMENWVSDDHFNLKSSFSDKLMFECSQNSMSIIMVHENSMKHGRRTRISKSKQELQDMMSRLSSFSSSASATSSRTNSLVFRSPRPAD